MFWSVDIFGEHFLWGFIEAIPNKTILDVGSGSGIPAIPLKIYFPKSRFYLLESRRKRANFLRNVIRKLNLEGISVINSRVEDWKDEVIADVVTARSVANPTLLRSWVVSHVHDRSVLVYTLNKSGEFDMEGAKTFCWQAGKRRCGWELFLSVLSTTSLLLSTFLMWTIEMPYGNVYLPFR